MDWAPSSLFLAQMCQSLGPFLEWSLAGDSLVIRCRDRLVYNMAKEKYIASKDREKKIRNEVMEYFEVKRKTFSFHSQKNIYLCPWSILVRCQTRFHTHKKKVFQINFLE